jgi:hypothetical protein
VTPRAAIGLVARRNRRIDVIDAQFLLVIVRNLCPRLPAKPRVALLKGDVIHITEKREDEIEEHRKSNYGPTASNIKYAISRTIR